MIQKRARRTAMIPVALQLHSVREDCLRDLPRTLEAVAKMGYDGVEFAGYYGRSADDLRRMLDDLGLRVAGSHLRIDTLLGDELEPTIKFNHALGNKFLIVPSLPEKMRDSKTSWVQTAHLMNEIAENLKSEKMRVGYHNHVVEFQSINGDLPWDIFFKATIPDVVMQLDTGHAMRAGVGPDGILEILRRYPSRARTVHLKDFSPLNDRILIGEGEMNWKEFFNVCETVGGTEWYIVEQETYAFPSLECVKRCIKNLKEILELK